jgi:cysteine desulfurase / selenocysteine lyase
MSTSEIALGEGLAGAGVPSGELGAPLSQGGGVAPAGLPSGDPLEGHALGRMIEQLANQYFSGVPGPALNIGRNDLPVLPLPPAGFPGPGPVSPPSGVFPAATSLGGGGVSPGSGAMPPTPGMLQQPTLASAPVPKESDLRTLPAMLSEGLGISSPVGLAQGFEPQGFEPHAFDSRGFDSKPDAAPYFLEIAGLPKGASHGAAAPGGTPAGFAPSGLGASVPFAGSGSPAAVPGAGSSQGNFGVPSSLHSGATAPGALPGTPSLDGAAPSAFGGAGGVPFDAGYSDPAGAVGQGLPQPARQRNVPSGAPSTPSFNGAAPTVRGYDGVAGQGGVAQPSGAVGQGAPQPLPGQGGASGADLSSLESASPSAPSTKTAGYSYDAHELSLPSSYGVHELGGKAPRALDRSARKQFDPTSVRNDFPILKERVHNHDLVWLDNAATTQKPQAVIDRIKYFYEHENSNIHRAAHTLAARSTDAYEASRETVRRFINAPSVQEIIFVRGTTEGINLVAQTWGRRHLQSGDEVVITWLEHHANIVPWQLICSERGARLKVAPVDDSGQIILYEYEKLLGPRTKFVSMSQVSNALGTIVPVQEMISMAHRYGAKVLVDGAQAVSHMPVDVQALDADFYVFSGHKIFGPTGIGAVFGKADVLEGLPPWQGGGNMIKDVTFEKTQFQGPPARFEAGTPNIADAVGLGAALDYVSSLGIDNISRYEHELLAYATERLVRIPGLRLYGTAPEKAGVLSFTIDGLRTEDIGVALDQEGIAVRAGHHCAQPILRRFGVEQTVRASLAPYNDTGDVDRLVSALQRLRVVRY